MTTTAHSTTQQGYDAPAALQPPFGTYWPNALQSLLIGLAENTVLGRGRIRWMTSKLIERIRPGPIDVLRFGFKQRLHHYGRYFVEKKMLLHIQDYDKRELEHIHAAVRPGCRFVDIGANAGIYVFAVKSWAPDAKILAVEANPIYANRLEFNVGANDLRDVLIENVAAGAATGTGAYNPKTESLVASDGASFEVPVKALHDMLVAAGFDRIDAMKVDIEGFEDRVATAILRHRAPVPVAAHFDPRSLDERDLRFVRRARLQHTHERAWHEHNI